MPKCQKCGKKFDSLQALKDHFRSVHPNDRFVMAKPTTSRNLVLSVVVVIIIMGGLVGYLIYTSGTGPSTTQTYFGELLTPISYSLYQNLSGVSYSTLSSVGVGSQVAPLTPITPASTLTFNGKPEVLFIGGEFCPLCGADRWSMVVALSKFGNFSNLEYMISAPDDGNVTTLTFRNATYTSQYISFVAIENEDRAHNILQIPNATDQTLWNALDANSYPFMDIGGQYIVKSEMYPYTDLNGLNWTQIGSQLNKPSSSVAKAVDGAANELISAICKIDGGAPSSVCSQSFAQNVSYVSPANTSPFTYSLAVMPVERPRL